MQSGPQRFGLDMSASAARGARGNLYVVVLQKDGENPLAPKSDEAIGKGYDEDEEEERDDDENDKDDDNDGDKPDRRRRRRDKRDREIPPLDLDGIDQRILAMPIPSGRYSGLACTEKKLMFVSFPRDGKPQLRAFDFRKRKTETVLTGVTSFVVSGDGRSMLIRDDKGFALISVSGKDRKKLAVDKVRVRVNPMREWPQILRETWRLQRDYFYDPNMHGVDWPAMWERWSPFLAHVRHRADLNLLIAEMIGELACGHNYVSGGQAPPPPRGRARRFARRGLRSARRPLPHRAHFPRPELEPGNARAADRAGRRRARRRLSDLGQRAAGGRHRQCVRRVREHR